MIAQEKITSGFDVEFLMGEEYIRYFLLTSMETGSIPWFSIQEVKDQFGNVIRRDATVIHPPNILNEKRLYPVNPDFEGNEHPFGYLGIPVYSDHHDDFSVTILQNSPVGADISVKIYPSIIIDMDNPANTSFYSNLFALNLDFKLEEKSTVLGNTLLGNIGLKIVLLDINGPLIDAAESLPEDENGNAVFSKEDTLNNLKNQLDRTVPFAIAGNGSIAAIQKKVFFADEIEETPNAIGIYLNLALQKGPIKDDFLGTRGDLDLAQNFLPLSDHMAFGFAKETYKNLGDDLFQKMAKLKEGTLDEYHYPIVYEGETKGKIKSIKVYPEQRQQTPSGPLLFTNALIIDIHGEIEIDNFFDPDFNFTVRLSPIERDGLFDFDLDYDLSFSPLAQIVVIFFEIVISYLLPQLGIPLLFATLLAVKMGEQMGADAASGVIAGEMGKTSFLDTLPHKLLIEQRRWDPLYFTSHRLEGDIRNLVINDKGFAFSAQDTFLGKNFEPISHMVIRDVHRDLDNIIDGLIYRAKDLRPYLNTDINHSYPASDRMPILELMPPNGDVESYRVALTFDQIMDRLASKNKGVEDKHIKNILYEPKKVHIIGHQIFKLLALSEIEEIEVGQRTRNVLTTEQTAQNGQIFRAQAEVELSEELGRTPTEEEIKTRLNSKIGTAVNILYYGRFIQLLNREMKFDLEPFEFAALQKRKLLTLGKDHIEIRTLHRNGNTTVYYRDIEFPFEPNVSKADNLMNLPKYNSEL